MLTREEYHKLKEELGDLIVRGTYASCCSNGVYFVLEYISENYTENHKEGVANAD